MRVLITAGPTREPLDPVRFLSNASSGQQGVALAEEAVSRDWNVDFVHGPLEVPLPNGVTLHPVTTAEEMLACCQRLHPQCDAVIGAAAVADYRPRQVLDKKQKREAEPWTLDLVPTTDILRKLGESKGTRVHAGFALETDDLLERGRAKATRKNLDWLVGNGPEALGQRTADYLLIAADGSATDLGRLTKRDLARHLCDAIAQTSNRSRHRDSR